MKQPVTVALMSFVFVIACACERICRAPASAHGDHPASKVTPTVDQILDKYVEAVGGKAAIGKLTTRMMKGSLIAPGGKAPIEVYEKAPNKFLVIIDSPASGMSKNGFDGVVAWTQNGQQGLREVSGQEAENFKREYDLRREIKLREFYFKMAVKGTEKTGDRETYVIEAATADGLTEALYFDLGSGLLVRRDVTIQSMPIQACFEDYQDVDGIKVPFTIRRVRSDFTFTQKFDRVIHNIAIDDVRFNKPAPH